MVLVPRFPSSQLQVLPKAFLVHSIIIAAVNDTCCTFSA